MPRIKNAQTLHNAVAQFVTAITPHVASVPGLTAGMLTTLTTDNGTLATTITAQIAAMEAAEAAKQARDNQATGVNNSFDQQILLVKAAGLASDIMADAGIPLRDTVISTVIPSIPTDLQVHGFATGLNKLKWKSGGNKPGTTYHIEYRLGATGPFLFLDTATRTGYDHLGQTPGVRVEYRVKAKRTTFESLYSNVAVAYP